MQLTIFTTKGSRKKAEHVERVLDLISRGGGGDSHIKGAGMLAGNFELNP